MLNTLSIFASTTIPNPGKEETPIDAERVVLYRFDTAII